MKSIGAAKFKEQFLSLLENLEPDGIIITKHGKPIARLMPTEFASKSLIGSLKGKISLNENILSTEVEWDAKS